MSTLAIVLARGHSLGMADQPDHISENLAENIRQLREARGLTQQQMARLSGLPRPTWGNLESGAANPTIAVLVKVATALQVSVEELLSAPRASAQFFAAATLPVRQRGLVQVRKLLPEPISNMEIDRLELPAGSHMAGIPHTPGTREYLTCETGTIELTESGQTWLLSPGDVVAFRGDQKHGYRNPGRARAIAYSVVALAPLSR